MKFKILILAFLCIIVQKSLCLFISLSPKEKYCLGYYLNKDDELNIKYVISGYTEENTKCEVSRGIINLFKLL